MDTEQKRKNIENAVKVIAALGIGFLVAPFVFLAVKGLVGLIVAGAIAFVAINLAPWFSAKVANWRLKAIKHEASQNPIETLENEYRKRQSVIASAGEKIRIWEGELNVFAQKIKDLIKKYPAEAPTFEEQYGKMKELLDFRKSKLREAQKGLSQFNDEIAKATMIWDVAQAALSATKSAGSDMDAFLSKIQTETALDSVQRSMCVAFADLDYALSEEKSAEKTKQYVQPSVANQSSVQRQSIS